MRRLAQGRVCQPLEAHGCVEFTDENGRWPGVLKKSYRQSLIY